MKTRPSVSAPTTLFGMPPNFLASSTQFQRVETSNISRIAVSGMPLLKTLWMVCHPSLLLHQDIAPSTSCIMLRNFATVPGYCLMLIPRERRRHSILQIRLCASVQIYKCYKYQKLSFLSDCPKLSEHTLSVLQAGPGAASMDA